jgi:lysyl-tRNA synthetase class 2
MPSERDVRIERQMALQAAGQSPYPVDTHRTHQAADIKTRFAELEASGLEVVVAGRVMAMRQIGALCFIRLQDASGQIQVVLREADTVEYAQFVALLDVGDIIEARGSAFTTKTGEQSVLGQTVRMLSKSLLPLPEKWHGLADVELRYRQRELDFLTNPTARQNIILRSKMVTAMRRFLDGHDFLEVETPILQPIPGGANARPFITHHNALGSDFYLRIAPELYLKRLVVGGFEKIYEIGRCFRNEGIDYSHNPEFTMLELYWAFAEKEEFVNFLEQLLMTVVKESVGDLPDFTAPWPRITFQQAILEACGIDIDSLETIEDLIKEVKVRKLKLDFKGCYGLPEYLDELWKKTARASMTSPTWVFDYPLGLKPLAKAHPTDPRKSASVQLVVQGAEVVNAYYHELNDPLDQRQRFQDQQSLKEQGSEEAQWTDEAFLTALEHGLPPTSGVGIGIDRLAMLLTGAPNLKEVIAFPTLKPLL